MSKMSETKVTKVIGITGGIASGKSTVTNVFKEQGFVVIDCDKITHDLLDKDIECISLIRKSFSEDVFTNNKIDRKKLGSVVFNNESELLKLNKIMHPLVRKEVLKNIKGDIVVLDCPLLYETGYENLCTCILLVFVSKETQIKRLMLRDNIDIETAKQKIDLQMSLEEKKSKNNIVIDNENSKEETINFINNLIKNIRRKVD